MPEERSRGEPPRNRLLDYTLRAKEDARALAGSLGGLTHEVESRLTIQAGSRPYWTLAAAAAVGFVLGGGLSRGWGRLLGGVALRAAASLAVSALASQAAPSGASPSPSRPPGGRP